MHITSTQLKWFAVLFGIGFIAAGILGFVPATVMDGKLFGIFAIDTMHNSVHLASGIIALLAAFNAKYTKLYFMIFGIIYGIVTVLGFALHGNVLMMHMNMADNYLHLVISVVSLYLGFLTKLV